MGNKAPDVIKQHNCLLPWLRPRALGCRVPATQPVCVATIRRWVKNVQEEELPRCAREMRDLLAFASCCRETRRDSLQILRPYSVHTARLLLVVKGEVTYIGSISGLWGLGRAGEEFIIKFLRERQEFLNSALWGLRKYETALARLLP